MKLYFTQAEAQQLYGLSNSWWSKKRHFKQKPDFIKEPNGRVKYSKKALDRYFYNDPKLLVNYDNWYKKDILEDRVIRGEREIYIKILEDDIIYKDLYFYPDEKLISEPIRFAGFRKISLSKVDHIDMCTWDNTLIGTSITQETVGMKKQMDYMIKYFPKDSYTLCSIHTKMIQSYLPIISYKKLVTVRSLLGNYTIDNLIIYLTPTQDELLNNQYPTLTIGKWNKAIFKKLIYSLNE